MTSYANHRSLGFMRRLFKRLHIQKLRHVLLSAQGAQVAEWLARQSLTNAARVRFPAGDLIPAP